MRIKSKEDYKRFLKADKISLGFEGKNPQIIPLTEAQYIWKYQRTLRKVEYYMNCKRGFINKIYEKILKYRLLRQQVKLGFHVPPNVFGPGLSIAHIGTIVINGSAMVGANCRLHVGTNIGFNGVEKGAPKIGDNVYISVGAKIIGNIDIADGVVVAANAVVNKSVKEKNIVVGGVPAKNISNNGDIISENRKGYKLI